MYSTFRRIFLAEDMPSPSRGVYVFLNSLAVAFVGEAVTALVHGESWLIWAGSLALGALFFYIGIKELWKPAAAHIKPYLRGIWIATFILFSLYLLHKPAALEEVVKWHTRLPGLSGYAVAAFSGALIMCSYWWFAGKLSLAIPEAAPPPTPATTAPLEQESPQPTAAVQELSDAEKHKVVYDLLANYRARNTEAISQRLDAGDVAAIEAEERWINDQLKQQRRDFRIELPRVPQARPKSRGIVIDGCENCTVEGNTVRGFDEGISIKNSPKLKAKENKVFGPEIPARQK